MIESYVVGGKVKLCRSMLLAGILVAGLTGCTYSYTGAEPPGGQSTSTPAPGWRPRMPR
jgi:hypothetical protein